MAVSTFSRLKYIKPQFAESLSGLVTVGPVAEHTRAQTRVVQTEYNKEHNGTKNTAEAAN